MSYVRFGKDSDVYVYGAALDLECCGCSLLQDNKSLFGGFYNTNSRSAMIEHLKLHKRRGDKVPPRVFKRLKEEINQIGEYYIPSNKAIEEHAKDLKGMKKYNKPGYSAAQQQKDWIKQLKLSTKKLKKTKVNKK